MAPNRPYAQQKKRSADDDPFWDSWEEEPSPSPVARRRSPSKRKKKTYKQLKGSVDDPFGLDGFGDTWESKKPARRILRRDSSPVVLPEDLVALEDAPDGSDSWCTSAVRKKSWSFEDHLKALTAKMAAIDAERDQKAALEAKKKAAKEAAEAQAAAEKSAAEAEWNQRVELAKGCVDSGEPVQALNMLHSLAQDLEIIYYIDQQSKKEVSDLYSSLYTHWELQQSLTQCLEPCSYNEPCGNSRSGDEESSFQSSIGGDTVKVNRSSLLEESSEIETGEATVVVDRFPPCLYRNSETDVSSGGGNTVKVHRSNKEESYRIVLEEGKENVSKNREERARNVQLNSRKENNAPQQNQACSELRESDEEAT